MPIITLLTDFGTADGYVGEMRGVLLSHDPALHLVDITHAISPGDVRSAAYVLRRTAPRFPRGTVHLVVVDPGVGSPRRALACEAGGQFYVGPDNGVMSGMLGGDAVVRTIEAPEHAAPTFHGRDVFAPAAAAIARSGALASDEGEKVLDPVMLAETAPYHEGKSLVGEVIYVDRFGTLVTNFNADNLPAWARIEVEGAELGKLQRTFSDVGRGELVVYTGSAGDIEIAVRDGSAARRLGIGVGAKIRARLG